MIASRHCPRCGRETRQEISSRLSASHAVHYGWWCLECKGWAPRRNGPGYWIGKEELLRLNVDLSVVRVVEVADGRRSARCARRGAEEHHWAPRAIFGEEAAKTWPTDFLCKPCHDEWHRKVTPQLVGWRY